MANLSNINNKFIVQDNSRILVNKTSDTGATLQVGGSLSTDGSVRAGNGVLYVGDGGTATCRIFGFGDTEMITGVSGATYLRVSGTSTLAGTLQAGQYILATGLAYGAVNSYTQIINGSTGAITGTTAAFSGNVSVIGSAKFIEVGFANTGTNFGFIGWNAASKYLFIGNSYNSAYNENLVINSSGKVGIGTANAANAELAIKSGSNCDLELYSESGGTAWQSYNRTTSSWGNIRLITGGGAAMLIDSIGNVGIGTTSPNYKLEVRTTTNTRAIQAVNSTTSGTNWGFQGGAYGVGASKNIGLQITAEGASTNYAALFDGGSVGIGVTDPDAKLEIKASGSTTGLTFKTTDAAGNENFFIQDGGRTGVRYYPLTVGQASGTSAASGARFQVVTTAGDFVVMNDGTTGIGTTNPQTKLEVNGGLVKIVDSGDTAFYGGDYVRVFGTQSYGFRNSAGSSIALISLNGNSYFNGGNVGIGVTGPNYNLEIGGTANPVVAIVSNINSATSSLYFGDSDAKDRGQIRYTHFGDFMELKAGGATRVYIESGINTAYTSDGLFNSNATPSYWNHGNGQFKLGYMDNGSGLYSGAYAFNVKSTDGIPVTGREIGAIYINDTSNGRKPLIISNQGRITMDQTNTSLANSNTGWLTIANGTSAYNFYNAYTGTDGGSGCARYRLNNTSPSFFDFYYTTTQVGYITTNGTDIFYANTSDYRLKEDLKDFNGLDMVSNINVYDFKWKESDNRMYGVVAHELQEIVPQAVVGNKDEEKLQAVDYSKLVPILIKSIQELKAEIELLKK